MHFPPVINHLSTRHATTLTSLCLRIMKNNFAYIQFISTSYYVTIFNMQKRHPENADMAYKHQLICRVDNTSQQNNAGVIYTFICYSAYANRRNGEQCSTEMLTYMYHNKVFCGHIIVRTNTCIQRCCFVQKQSVAQNVSNDNVLQSRTEKIIEKQKM